jgi:hypothetical protein
LSTRNVPPNFSTSFGMRVRAIMSVEPPGGNGTIIVTGFSGHAANVVAASPIERTLANDLKETLFTYFFL